MLLVQRVSRDEETDEEPRKGKTHVDDPHGAQRLGECGAGNGLLGGRERLDQADAGAGGASAKGGGGLGTEAGYELGLLRLHHVVEDDGADDDGDGGAEIAREAKSGGGGCNVAFLAMVLVVIGEGKEVVGGNGGGGAVGSSR